jgi:mRNA interferase YafQ
MMKRKKDEGKLWDIVDKLLKSNPLPQKHKDHSLGGNWKNRRECHIEPDWLLIYCVREDDLILERTCSHSDIFK